MPVQTRSQTRASKLTLTPKTEPSNELLKILNNRFIEIMNSYFDALSKRNNLIEEFHVFTELSEYFQYRHIESYWSPIVKEIFEKMISLSLKFHSRIENREFDSTLNSIEYSSYEIDQFIQAPSENLKICYEEIQKHTQVPILEPIPAPRNFTRESENTFVDKFFKSDELNNRLYKYFKHLGFIKNMTNHMNNLTDSANLNEEIEHFTQLSKYFQRAHSQALSSPKSHKLFEFVKVKSLEYQSRLENNEFISSVMSDNISKNLAICYQKLQTHK